MIAKLVFKLPEEEEEHLAAIRGMSYKFVIEHMDEYFRGRLKYEETLSKSVREALEAARQELLELKQEAEE